MSKQKNSGKSFWNKIRSKFLWWERWSLRKKITALITALITFSLISIPLIADVITILKHFEKPNNHIGDYSENPSVTCLANDKRGFLSVDPKASLSHREWIGDDPTRISKPFQIQARLVTVSELRAYVASKPSQAVLDSLGRSTWEIADNREPARDIPWVVAQDYGKWITKTTDDGCRYQLPDINQWRQAVAALAHSDDDPEWGLFYGEFRWGMREWTEDSCDEGGRRSVGYEWRQDNEDDGNKAQIPAATCLGPHHVEDGFQKQGFRLIRAPAGIISSWLNFFGGI
ncbi:MAG: hypothetical protein LGR52_01170 [Candidatus Thiosymbion ectosymbiont of Robbea hypermnestra]|nr:hypothetical protein [Candidatus Thiosymbion ectosymbiont of Robbea hypermnestra]